jgi:hypothetical protein
MKCLRSKKEKKALIMSKSRGDKWALWAVISVAALVGIRSEDTAVGRALWGAVVSMLAASSLAVLGILPSEAHILNSARHSVSIY